jgi:ubiquinone/menaquinone biosynthesis C-methylase UbiE
VNRRFTNAIRFVMDELLPPILRDSRWFMYPFFWIAYRGKNVREAMDFKRNVFAYSRKQYADFYSSLDSVSRNRETDLNNGCIKAILAAIDSADRSIVDVGCGGGFLLRKFREKFPDLSLSGCDVTERPSALPAEIEFIRADIMDLDLPADSHDVVTCCHVLEHVLDYRGVMRKLAAAARRKLILVVPLQRPYFYTLDEHVNFFLFPEQCAYEVGLAEHRWERIDGDLFYIGIKP